MLPPIDENILKCTTRKGKNNKRDDNNTWFSSNLGASMNDTITDNSSTIDESTAVSLTITNNHEENSTAMKFGKKRNKFQPKEV